MARNDNNYIKYADDELIIGEGGSIIVQFEPSRDKVVMGQYQAGDKTFDIVFWGNTNSLPEEREALVGGNNIVPQIIRTKRDIILGGGLMTYIERFENNERIIEEIEMPAEFADFIEANEDLYGGMEECCNDLLMHGNYYIEMGITGNGKPAYIKPHRARNVRAQRQGSDGIIPTYWLNGSWGKVNSLQKLMEVKNLTSIPAYRPDKDLQPKCLYHGADKLMGGPYYYDPHYAGSSTWIKVANTIPTFHLSNLENGFNIRYLIKVPEDYFMRSLSDDKRKDVEKIKTHLAQAKRDFTSKINSFLAGAENAGRGLIVTKHFYKHLQKEWPELEIIPLEVDLKDEAMLKLYDSSNQANTSAHGIPPVLAGLATGAKMTSGSEIRNLYNFWQISATTIPRKQLLKPWVITWKRFGLDRKTKLGFRNMELTTTDKNPNGMQPSIDQNAE